MKGASGIRVLSFPGDGFVTIAMFFKLPETPVKKEAMLLWDSELGLQGYGIPAMAMISLLAFTNSLFSSIRNSAEEEVMLCLDAELGVRVCGFHSMLLLQLFSNSPFSGSYWKLW